MGVNPEVIRLFQNLTAEIKIADYEWSISADMPGMRSRVLQHRPPLPRLRCAGEADPAG